MNMNAEKAAHVWHFQDTNPVDQPRISELVQGHH